MNGCVSWEAREPRDSCRWQCSLQALDFLYKKMGMETPSSCFFNFPGLFKNVFLGVRCSTAAFCTVGEHIVLFLSLLFCGYLEVEHSFHVYYGIGCASSDQAQGQHTTGLLGPLAQFPQSQGLWRPER